MSRVPPALARRIDRLARRAHAFHRFAHHPLCEAYAGEVVRAGPRMLLCRGCSFAAAGSVAGVLAALASPLPHPAAFALALPLAAVAARATVAQSGAARRGKLFTRAAPSSMAAALVTLGLRAGGPAGVAVATTVLAVAFAAAALYRRRGPDRTPCRACPEREAPRVCSGYRRMIRREAAFARVAGRLLRSIPTASPPAMPGSGDVGP